VHFVGTLFVKFKVQFIANQPVADLQDAVVEVEVEDK
jgi:hypothetical protein